MQLSIAIVNPTTVLTKAPTFLDLFNKVGVQIVALSETAATEHVQRKVSKQLAKQQILSIWSPPAAPQREAVTDRLFERGKPTGTAVLSKVPCRTSRLPIEPPWSVNPRFVHTIVQLGQSHFQLCVVYGYAHSQCNKNATSQTNDIFQFLLKQVEQIPLPFLICGDFNLEPDKLPCWHSFLQKGCVDLATLHQHIYHSPMPFTCNNATRPDTAIFSKELAPFVTAIRVLGTEWFSAHSPVACTVTLPEPTLFCRRIRLPKSWCEFGPSTEKLESAFHSRCGEMQVETLEEWGHMVEETVDQWLSEQNSDILPSRLPKSFRGRCQTPRIQKHPVCSPLRKGAMGDFEPSDEILSISTKRHVKQIRRITSLRHRLNFEGFVPSNSPKFQGLVEEWICILRAPVLDKHFAFWISSQPELGYPPWPLPSVQWLQDLLSLTQHHLNIALAFDRRCFVKKQQYSTYLDNKHQGSKRAFSYVRGTPKAPVTHLQDIVECQAEALWDPATSQVRLSGPEIHRLQVASPVTIQQSSGIIVARDEQAVTLALQTWPEERPASTWINQQTLIIDPSDVATKLSEYWLPLWTLPMNAGDTETDLDFVLQHLPPQQPLKIELSLDNLKKAISRLRSHSALGVDGISAKELKLLPDCILSVLLRVFENYTTGFPKDFMIARTFPLNKTEGIPCNSQTRPITVLAQLYRVWGALVCHQALQQWGSRFPKQVTGFLPKRGSLLAAYSAQAEHEIDTYSGLESSGLTLDLKKCFNLIRHHGAFRVLQALSFPMAILQQWIASIGNVTRYWIIENSVHGPYPCNNGLPEGDVFSVVAMLGIALTWTAHVQAIANHQATTWAYADNWAWKVLQFEVHRLVYQATSRVVGAFGLCIDFGKTWFWASNNQLASLVNALLKDEIPQVDIQRKHHAKDLGLEMRYSGPNRLGHVKSRYQEGQDRLSRLQHLRETLKVKEHLLDASIWPATFYGSEMYPVPQQTLQTFRSTAADALFGASHAMNPAIALLFTSGRILDPAFVCTFNAIRTARTWLWKQSEATRNLFYGCAAHASGKPQDVKGPASTLKSYLQRINWGITAHGFLEIDGFTHCHLVFDSLQRIYRFLIKAWQDDFLVLHSHRKDLHSLRNPSRCDTVQVLAKLSDSTRRSMIREIAGAFQLASQKAKWNTAANSQCEFCDEEDSRIHRLTACPAFQEVRRPFQSTLDALNELDHSMRTFPIIHCHPDSDAHLLLHFHEPVATVCDSAISLARQLIHFQSGHSVVFH